MERNATQGAMRLERDIEAEVYQACRYGYHRNAEFCRLSERKKRFEVYERLSDIKSKYRNREFWSKRVLSAEKNTRKIAENLQNRLKEDSNCGRHLVMTIAEYIQNHLKKDDLSDQLTQDLSAPLADGK